MFEGIFGKLSGKDKIDLPEVKKTKATVKNTVTKEIIKEEVKEVPKVVPSPKNDFITTQCIEMGKDIKNDVETISRAFFKSKNPLKSKAYTELRYFLDSLEQYEKRALQDMTYLEFKEKDEQIFIKLKGGYSQYLSKGANLNEELKKTIDIVFLDIKKLPSKAHRYWYYKIYIWQEID